MNLSNLFKNNKFRNLTRVSNIEATKKTTFLNFNAKKVFNYLKQMFIKALIFWYFDLKNCIWIETIALSYAINRMLNQLNINLNVLLNDLNKSHFD